ncbi:hypothetical protein BT96DRAFT_987350 [Gymnopus androsaceus JB14]|uniref:NmrA-like domain-containing protein n=1 Tax=Gymnopus androsaceus JB14 TaxID=1447944 RepID=A0A6A4IB07_9AGAR|nr:hypothetical protein BT96DRAFT_987350 [Gymnopus androsaceus JB14]
MAPTYTSFVVLGSGGSISPYIIDALSKEPDVKKLIVLSRSSSSSKPIPPSSSKAEFLQVDYDDHASLVNIFRTHGTEVIVSTLPNAAVNTQKKVALAAKEAGTVKLFFPTEYEVVTYGLGGKGEGWLSEKDEIDDFLKSIDLPSARIFNGILMRWILWLNGYDANGKINILKDRGDAPISLTAEEDIGEFIAYVSTHLPPSQLANARFRLEGERLTTKEFASRLGKPIEYVDAIPGDDSEIRNTVAAKCELGAGSTGYNHELKKDNDVTGPEGAGSGNRLWPGHVWRKIEDVLELDKI